MPPAWKVRLEAERRALVEQQLADGSCRVRKANARDWKRLEAAKQRRDQAGAIPYEADAWARARGLPGAPPVVVEGDEILDVAS
jgi:hypothetical protein